MQIVTNSAAETEAAGAALAARLKPGCVVALYGGLGMGQNRVCSRSGRLD